MLSVVAFDGRESDEVRMRRMEARRTSWDLGLGHCHCELWMSLFYIVYRHHHLRYAEIISKVAAMAEGNPQSSEHTPIISVAQHRRRVFTVSAPQKTGKVLMIDL